MRKLVLLLAGLVLVAAACGGDEEPEDSTTTTLRTAASTTATVPPTTSGPTTLVETTAPAEEGESEVGVTTSPATTEATPVLTLDAVVTLRAVGPMRIGMTVDEASRAAGLPLRRDFGRQSTSSCYYVTAGAAVPGVSIMVVDDLIARIDIDSPSPLATRSGVRIGTSAADLREVYPNNIQRANEAVLNGEAMAFVPNDDFDADFRIYFEIEDGQVARYRLGVKPAINYLRGCPEE